MIRNLTGGEMSKFFDSIKVSKSVKSEVDKRFNEIEMEGFQNEIRADAFLTKILYDFGEDWSGCKTFSKLFLLQFAEAYAQKKVSEFKERLESNKHENNTRQPIQH